MGIRLLQGHGDIRPQTPDFELLASQEEKRVYLTCFHMLQNRQDAEDCAQDAMLKAFRSFSSYRGDAQFSTWISRIAMNCCIDFIRRRRKVVSLDEMRDEGFDVADEKENVYARLDENERKRLLREGLQKLPEEARALIVLRDMEGRSYEETADILKLPLGTVKSRLNRARAKLNRILSENAELFSSASV